MPKMPKPDFKTYQETKEQLAAASGLDPRAMDAFRDQLLLVLVQRAGGEVTVPVAEVDDTDGLIMTMEIEPNEREFRLKVGSKQ